MCLLDCSAVRRGCRPYAGQRLFNKDMNQAEVVSMMLGYTPLPFEANPALFQSINAPPNAQNMLRQMLQRNPTARPALKDVSGSAAFQASLFDVHVHTAILYTLRPKTMCCSSQSSTVVMCVVTCAEPGQDAFQIDSMQCKQASLNAGRNLHFLASVCVKISHVCLGLHRKHVEPFILPCRCCPTACLQRCLKHNSFKQSVHSLLTKSGAQTFGARCQMHWTVWTVLTSMVCNVLIHTPTDLERTMFKLVKKQLLCARRPFCNCRIPVSELCCLQVNARLHVLSLLL